MLADIQDELKRAMLAGEKDRVTVLRGLLAAIQNAEIEKKTSLTDEEIASVLQKEAKRRTEAAAMYEQGGSTDRKDRELMEKAIIAEFLPEQLDTESIEKIVMKAIDEVGATSQSDMGKVIGIVRQETAGKADGAEIARITKEKLGS